MKVRVINNEGKEWVLDLMPDFSMDKLKMMAFGHFYPQPAGSAEPPASSSSSSSSSSSTSWMLRSVVHYRMILVRSGEVLTEDGAVVEAGLQDNGEEGVKVSFDLNTLAIIHY